MDNEKLKKECKSIVDECFSKVNRKSRSGNSLQAFKDRTELAIDAQNESEKACHEYLLETLNPNGAKKFADTGFINDYIIQKTNDLITKNKL